MATNNTITLKLIVDKSRNQVVYAEADSKFVDILLSFLTLPIGTILSLTNNKLFSPGSLNNLYQSVVDLDDKYFDLMASKAMLLHPSNSAEGKLSDLAIHIEGSTVLQYYVCDESCHWELLSPYANTKCRCGASMARKVKVTRKRSSCEEYEGVFMKGLTRFMISDGWVITPASTRVVLSLLEQVNSFEEREVHFGPSDIIRLLRCSLDSNTVLTDAFLAERDRSNSSKIPGIVVRQNRRTSSSSIANIKLKLFIDRKDKKVIYAECDEYFIDLLFRFLTFPMGYVVKKLEGKFPISCYNNLYKSVLNLDEASYFQTCSRDFLINPMLPEHLYYHNQLINIPARAPDKFYMCRTSCCQSTDLSLIANVRCQCGVITNKRMKLIDCREIIKRTVYMVTDDLVVTPLPSISVISLYLMRAREGVEEMDVTVGEDEALALLQASMISKTVLTDLFTAEQN
ncbi:uncharacterized protein [Typha angustifolia]|uniref:uncharacterized protein n=1 Tax=Typha angustifolia TaxID=59011 RepID=UPI003C2B4ACC